MAQSTWRWRTRQSATAAIMNFAQLCGPVATNGAVTNVTLQDLFFPEGVERDDLLVLAALRALVLALGLLRQLGRLRGCRRLGFLRALAASLELQAEIHGGVVEGGDGGEGDEQPLLLIVEAQRHGKAGLFDLQSPELILQDDGHRFRILLMQPVGDLHIRMIGAEGDVEMMVAGEDALG